jgi:hypothetical protein
MQMKLKRKLKIAENLYFLLIALLGLGAAFITDGVGMGQKWHAAIVSTGVAFGTAIWLLRPRWKRRQFWLAVAICFGIHVVITWLIFSRLFAGFQHLGILVWAPTGFIEAVYLLGILPILERRLISSRSHFAGR